MAPRLRLITGCCAIALLLIGLGLFVSWAVQAEIEHSGRWIGGVQVARRRVVGPPRLVVAALWPSLIGVTLGLDWLLTGSPRRPPATTAAPRRKSYRLVGALQAAALAVLLVPGAFIVLAGASRLVYYPEVQRRLARFEKGRPARQAKSSFSTFMEQLEDPDAATRAQAAEAIGEMEVYLSQGGVPALTERLRDEDRVAMAAAKALGKIGRYARLAVPELERLLERGSRGRRGAPSTERDPLRVCAAEALAKVDGERELSDCLKEKDPEIRWCAAHGLGMMAQNPRKPVHAAGNLRAALEVEKDEDVRAAIRGALDVLDPQEPLSDLIRKLDDPAAGVRLGAATTLLGRGEEAKAAAPKLAELLHDPDPEVRVAAARVVVRADPQSPLKIDALLLMLGSREDYDRRHAAELLGQMGTEAARALPDLQAALNDHDRIVRVTAATAIWKISREPGDVIRVLTEILEAEDPAGGAHIRALITLKDIGPRAQAAIPVVKAVYDHGPSRVRAYAKSALRSIEGPIAPSVGVGPDAAPSISGAESAGRIEVGGRSAGDRPPP
ncbi:MAG TPA: HEAT repeat domain-containing protein [Candidatus Hydrogenedentes bacterium]|nr:HEAT repeat domain-containing protein [Candidatus Hydrogenedentota bacterium]